MSVKTIATRESYGETLVQLGHEHDNIVVLDADLAGATKTGMFAKAFRRCVFWVTGSVSGFLADAYHRAGPLSSQSCRSVLQARQAVPPPAVLRCMPACPAVLRR